MVFQSRCIQLHLFCIKNYFNYSPNIYLIIFFLKKCSLRFLLKIEVLGLIRSTLLQFPPHHGYRGNEDYDLSSEGHSRSIKYVSFMKYFYEIKLSDFYYKIHVLLFFKLIEIMIVGEEFKISDSLK